MPIFIPRGEKRMIEPERMQAHAFLKGKLKTLALHFHTFTRLKFDPPTCIKCEDESGQKGFLSKASDTTLICLRCGAEYELKEI